MRTIARLLAVSALAATAAAQGAPALLADVESLSPANPGSFYEPKRGAVWAPYVYFGADADGHGMELWRSNGALGSAERVVDLNVTSGSDPEPIGVLGGWLLFTADDGVSGRSLWRTDGTTAGTSLLGAAGLSPTLFVPYGSWYYFVADGRLWKTDGQPGNTITVDPTYLGDVYEVAASGSSLWLLTDNGGSYELWASDGGSTAYQVQTFADQPAGLTGLPGLQVLFACDDGSSGTELWTSNGTPAGTQMLVDIYAGSEGSGPNGFTALGGVAYFAASEGSTRRLWRSDGTPAGTWAIDTPNGPRFPDNIAAAGSRLFFRAQDAAGANAEPWVSDGTANGTYEVADVWPGSPSSGVGDFAYDGTQWTYFTAHDGSTGYELWRTNLVLTQRVSDIQPGFLDSSPSILGIANGYCIFAAVHTQPAQTELYASQGNASHLVRDLRAGDNGSSSPEGIVAQVDGRFWFAGKYQNLGREPHFSDGTAAGTTFLVDATPGSASSPVSRAASWGPYSFFTTLGGKLWRTAGTVLSTNAIAGVLQTDEMVQFAGKLYFEASTGPVGFELFVLESPLVAPTLLKEIMPGPGGSTIRELTPVGNRLFFVAQDPQSQIGYGNLWVSDGTTNGTTQVYVHGQALTEPSRLRALGRRVVYSLGFSSPKLVISDGTAAGTLTIGDLYATHERVESGERLFLAGEIPGAGTGVELSVTDGTTIQLVKDIRPGLASSNLYGLTPFGGGVLFVADDGTHGFELWKSDGTAAGTQMVADVRPGPVSGCPSVGGNGAPEEGFVYAPRGAARALFLANDGVAGMELWRTDGTTAGTAAHADIQPGLLGSWPSPPVRAGARLAFAATQNELPAAPVGRELFAMPSMAAAEPFGSPCAVSLASTPLARGVGTPRLGNAAFALRVSTAPATPALLVLGLPADLSTPPCELRIANFLFTFGAASDGQGIAQVALPVPPEPALAGLRLAGQWAVPQSGGPFAGQFALSNGVDIVLAAD